VSVGHEGQPAKTDKPIEVSFGVCVRGRYAGTGKCPVTMPTDQTHAVPSARRESVYDPLEPWSVGPGCCVSRRLDVSSFTLSLTSQVMTCTVAYYGLTGPSNDLLGRV